MDASAGAKRFAEIMSFYTEIIQHDPRFHSNDSIRDLNLLEPITRRAVENIIADAAVANITLMVTETFRSKERQVVLFNQGASHLKDVGVHHYGLACDFAKVIDGKPSWAGDWGFLRDLAKKHGLISGLDWGQPYAKHSFVDPDHVQRIMIWEQARLFSGDWYPADPSIEIAV
ncbi:MAG TPA: M15 family metallopeptidase [Verrucomicrobiae bacterium]|nr:M15 family metallopeptidase [Verrucomicrobiae bacterium]